jgi:tRNA-dihydrouridine synthase
MVGRVTFGRPWIFKEIHDLLRVESLELRDVSSSVAKVKSLNPQPLTLNPQPSTLDFDQKLDILEELLRINVERIDEKRGILHTRRHLAATPIFKAIPNFRQTRIAMLRAETMSDLIDILEGTRALLSPQTKLDC